MEIQQCVNGLYYVKKGLTFRCGLQVKLF